MHSSLTIIGKFSINSVKGSTNKKVFPEFPAFFKLLPNLLQDCAVFSTSSLSGFGLFTESLEGGTFQNFAYFGIIAWIFIYMFFSLSTTCQSKYCIWISWKRPVRARFRVPRRPVPVWHLPSWAFCAKCAIRLPFPVFPVIQANLQLLQDRNLNVVLYLLGSDLLAQSTESQYAQNNKIQQKLSQVQLKRFKMKLVHMKNLQAQTKNKTQKSVSNHLRHKYSPNMFMPYMESPTDGLDSEWWSIP